MTREEAKQIALKEIEEGIRQESDDAIFMMSPKTGKCSWTYKEARDSILEDKCLEGSNANLIDMVLKYEKYMEKNNNIT